jgi:DNA-binding response OmpR family regulator
MDWRFSGQSTRRCRVLYVTPIADQCDVFRGVTRGTHFEVDHAADADAGMAALQRLKYHLVLVWTNGIDGDALGVLRRIKSDVKLRSLPVLVIGADGDLKEITEAYSAGASCVIGAPQAREQFAVWAKAVLGFWAAYAQLPFCPLD